MSTKYCRDPTDVGSYLRPMWDPTSAGPHPRAYLPAQATRGGPPIQHDRTHTCWIDQPSMVFREQFLKQQAADEAGSLDAIARGTNGKAGFLLAENAKNVARLRFLSHKMDDLGDGLGLTIARRDSHTHPINLSTSPGMLSAMHTPPPHLEASHSLLGIGSGGLPGAGGSGSGESFLKKFEQRLEQLLSKGAQQQELQIKQLSSRVEGLASELGKATATIAVLAASTERAREPEIEASLVYVRQPRVLDPPSNSTSPSTLSHEWRMGVSGQL